jgi:thioredoxin reductase
VQERYDTIIVGGGPAGLSAALVLGRCMRRTLVCDSGRYRNQNSQALHCFMSQDGIAPSGLLTLAREQLRPYDSVEVRQAEVSRIARAADGFVVSADMGEARADTVLVATGVVDELPSIEGIRPLFGRSVHVCPYCDGWEHRNAPVAAYGKREKGAGLALLLRQWTHDLVLCTHGPAELREDELRRLRARGIAVREEPIARLEAENGCLQSIVFADGTRLARRALFFNTGQHPRSAVLEELGCRYGPKGVECDADGQTSIAGVYVAGDVSRDVQLAIIAAAEGARAALAINRALLARANCSSGT